MIMILRLRQAINKVLFCAGISGDSATFLKLLRNTKRFKWSQKAGASLKVNNDAEETYDLRLKQKAFKIYLRTFSGDIAIFYEIFWNKVYKLPGDSYRNVETIVDLGANVGLATLYFRHQYPDGVIYSVEPEPSNYELLLKNLNNEILHQNIVPMHAAIDAEDGEAAVHVNGLLYNATITAANNTGSVVKMISMKTLLNKFNIERIDLLKIDIEGTEQRLFEENTEWLDKVRHLLIEFHSELIKSFCTEVLVSKGFSIHPIKAGNGNSYLLRAVNENIK